MPDARRPWWSLEPIKTWERSGFKPWEEWPLGWRRAAGLLGLLWLSAVAGYLLSRWPLNLFGVGALQSVASGIVAMIAIIADRDRDWNRTLRRMHWASAGILASATLIALVQALGNRDS